MKVLFDTSVLVAAIIAEHPQHAPARTWLERAKAHDVKAVISSHTLAELFSVLTSLPLQPRLGPAAARRLIVENVRKVARAVPLAPSDYDAVLARLTELGCSGGAAYDALIARAAEKTGVDRLLTLDISGLRRVWPDGAAVIQAP